MGAAGNPIKQDTTDDGQGRYYLYGSPPFNYGLLPQVGSLTQPMLMLLKVLGMIHLGL